MFTARSVLCGLVCLFCWLGKAYGQRTYASRSVLADGAWYKLAVKDPGVYRVDLPLLQSMGISTNNLAAGAVRIYGNGGGMLPEDNAVPRPDDLVENAIFIMDGGDGVINGNDYVLFYAPGPHTWENTPQGFRHTRHLYADSACYFLQIRPGGLRITENTTVSPPGGPATTFDYRAFYEKDLYNILSSGKEWFGEEFNAATPQRNIPLPLPAAGVTEMTLRFRAVARSTAGSQFELAGQRFAPRPVSGNIFEEYATAVEGTFPYAGNGNIALQYQGNAAARGWLDFLEIQGRSPLAMPASGMLLFRDTRCTGTFRITGTGPQTLVWEITDPLHPLQLKTRPDGNALLFDRDCSVLREYAAFNPDALPKPLYVGPVANQNLHGSEVAGMLIIAPSALQAEAGRLAAWHRSAPQLNVAVVPVEEIYNEFGAGLPDPTALRDFVKMHYDRCGLKYLLLFGSASFMYKDASNKVPTWQSAASLHGINTHMSDDYFGFLNDDDHIGGNPLLDVAIGRLPVRNEAEAAAVVNKIMQYHSPESFGPWRNEMTFAADDEDGNLHLGDAETVSRIIEQEQPRYNISKLYLDAFPQVSGASGSRYPAVNEAINRRMFNGTLVWNYNGHGSFSRLAEEAVLDETSLNAWNNPHRLPLMVTATCDFAPFDNPQFHSLGEKLLSREKGGAIALMTTTRAVFAYSNLVMNANYFRLAFQPRADGSMPTLGEGAMYAKNETYASFGDIVNNRKFQLLGDPALTLAFPKWRVYTDSVNGRPAGAADTLKALGAYTIAGSVRDATGQVRTAYNGMLHITVFDKPVARRTRGNDPGSTVVDYLQQDHALFKGSQPVQNGLFRFTFVVPKDIAQSAGKGKISYYTSNETEDGAGTYAGLAVTGTAADVPADVQGPVIQAWMNDESFRDGGITGEDPLLLLHLQDESGINATGNGIGHDIVAILDDSTRFYIMNEFYTATSGSFREGRVIFPLAGLPPGKHTLTIRAWDSHNNSSTINIHFEVVPKSLLAVENVYNYPNPFRDHTRFVFSHNQQGADLDVLIRIFTAAGQHVRTIRSTINGANSRYSGIPWNGRADSGVRLTPGIYFYQVSVKDLNQKEKVFGGKLILL